MKKEDMLSRRLLYALYGIDEIFVKRAKEMHINNTEISILFVLDNESSFSQKDLSEQMCIPLTTINTIIKKWEKDGIVTQVPIEGKRREMQIILTEKGQLYAEECLGCIYDSQAEAMKLTIERYPEEFVAALEYYSDCQKQFAGQEQEKQTV